jgi:hypothetical protein
MAVPIGIGVNTITASSRDRGVDVCFGKRTYAELCHCRVLTIMMGDFTK